MWPRLRSFDSGPLFCLPHGAALLTNRPPWRLTVDNWLKVFFGVTFFRFCIWTPCFIWICIHNPWHSKFFFLMLLLNVHRAFIMRKILLETLVMNNLCYNVWSQSNSFVQIAYTTTHFWRLMSIFLNKHYLKRGTLLSIFSGQGNHGTERRVSWRQTVTEMWGMKHGLSTTWHIRVASLPMIMSNQHELI